MVQHLIDKGPNFDCETVIAKCVAYKRDVVEKDEYDTGERQKLNLGHTIGHGIEAGSHFQITHGQAVAAGMAIVTRAAVANGLCAPVDYECIKTVLNRFKLPINTDFTADTLYISALSDKKRSGGIVKLIIPRSIGHCDIVPMPVTEMKSFIEAGL